MAETPAPRPIPRPRRAGADGSEPPDPRPPGWAGLWIAPAAVLLGFAAGFVGTFIVQLVGHALGSPLVHPTPAVNLVSDLVFDLGFVLAALYFTYVSRWQGRITFGYRRIPWRLGVGAVLGAGVLYYVGTLIYAAAVSVHSTDKLPSDLRISQSTAAAIGASVFVCVVAPICEEFFFRGFLFGVLRRMRVRVAGHDLGVWIAAVIVGLLFGLAHTGSANSAFLIPLGFLGFVLCLLRWRTGSLYPGMALHSLNNCIALGINELAWSVGPIIGLCAASLLVIGLITGPFSRARG